MFSTTFYVEGTPIPKGRPRFKRVGSFVSTYSPVKTQTYEKWVGECSRSAMGDQEPLETPVRLLITFFMPIPVSYTKKRKDACLNGSERHLKKPDLDNLVKTVCDAMNGIVYKDDGQVVSISAKKCYGVPMVSISVFEDLP